MSTRNPDGAFLFWARDWLTDEHVVLMSPAAKGVYVDLLCHCWLEGSLPACSEHLARIARADAAAFAALWVELAPRFSEHPTQAGRLVNRRMVEEREKADDRRKARSDKASAAAAARWCRSDPAARSIARGNARSIANASFVAMLGDAHQTKPSTTPLPPETGGKRGKPRGADPAAESGQKQPAPKPERPRPSTIDSPPATWGEDAEIKLQAALQASTFRSALPALQRRFECAKAAARLHARSIAPDDLSELIRLDGEKAETPGALLAIWIEGDQCRAVLDEQDMKAKERGARARVVVSDDLLDGIYGGEQPKPAASVVGQVLQRMGGA